MNSTVSAEPKFFSFHSKEWIEIALGVLNSSDLCDNLVKNSALDFITTILKRIPNCMQNKNMLQEILGSIFMYMNNIDDDVEDDWLKPARGF